MQRRCIGALVALGLLACNDRTRSPEHVDAAIDSEAKNKAFGAIDTSAIDANVSPCSDFYAYACGGWEANARIPDDEGAWLRVWSALRAASDDTAAAILKRDASEPSSDPSSRALGDFFAACLDTTAIDARGDVDLRAELDRIDTSSPEKTATSIARLHALGVDAIFALEPEPDPHDARATIAVVRQPSLSIPEARYADSESLRALGAYATRLFVLAGDAPDRADDEASAAIDLEARLAADFESRAVFRDPAHAVRIASVHDLARIQPHLQWTAYFAALGIDAPARIHVPTERYLRSLSAALSEAATLRAHLRWSLLRSMAPQASSAYREAAFAFARNETGQSSPPPRERECTRLVETLAGDALAPAFATAVIDPSTAQRALGLAGEVRAELAREYMTAHRDSIALKLARMRIEIDTPPDPVSLPDFDRQGFMIDLLRERESARKMGLSRVGKPTADRSGDIFFAPNAAFDPRRNRIGISPALLLGATLPERTDAAELGSLGAIIGHELVHAFDRTGSRYDANGAFDRTGETGPTIETDAITRDLDAAHLRSGALLDETVADVEGVEIARRALHHLVPDADDQDFFTAYAQLWCGKLRPEAMRAFVSSDAHPPPHVRVNEAVRRSPGFAQAFSCK
ncbi:MAG: M13 family metallopeptidase [Polyangiaceae bacterium]